MSAVESIRPTRQFFYIGKPDHSAALAPIPDEDQRRIGKRLHNKTPRGIRTLAGSLATVLGLGIAPVSLETGVAMASPGRIVEQHAVFQTEIQDMLLHSNKVAKFSDIREFVTKASQSIFQDVFNPHIGLEENGTIKFIGGQEEKWDSKNTRKAHTISLVAHFPKIPLFKTKDGKKIVYERVERGGVSLTVSRDLEKSYLDLVNNHMRTTQEIKNEASKISHISAYYYDDVNYRHSVSIFRAANGWGLTINGNLTVYTDKRDTNIGDDVFTVERFENAKQIISEVLRFLPLPHQEDIMAPDSN